MSRWTKLIFITFLYMGFILSVSCSAQANPTGDQSFPRDKWFFLINNLDTPDRLAEAISLTSDAKSHGLNGVVLSAFLDTITMWSDTRIENLKAFKSHCDEIGLELIPMMFSAGYGGAVIGHSPNLAAATSFIDVPFIVEDSYIHRDTSDLGLIKNSGFEELDRYGHPSGFSFRDEFGKVLLVDDKIKHSGANSLRLENFSLSESGHARLSTTVNLKKRTEYEASIWVKTENLEPYSCLHITPLIPDQTRTLQVEYIQNVPQSNQDWTKYSFRFFSGEYTQTVLLFGALDGKSGKVWLDDIQVIECGTAGDVLKRPGTPLVVKNRDRDFTYEEGIDYEPYQGLHAISYISHPLILKLTPNSRIHNGDHLLVSGYSVSRVWKANGSSQISVCMSQPALYEYWAAQVDALYPILKMKKAFFSMDEIRSGGACETCKSRQMSMAQILGDCVTRQVEMVRKHDPKIEVYIWADMFDPKANAKANYYNVDGSFVGSWEYVPKDIIMACWIYQYRVNSLKFFSEQGFRTLGSPYYDKHSLDDTIGWYNELSKTDGAIGIMYTTWKNDFSFLIPFADYLEERESEK